MTRIRVYRKPYQIERRTMRKHALARKLAFLAAA